VLLATGARDVEPEIDGLHEAMQAGQVRYCPVCDGFETQGQRVAVLGRAGTACTNRSSSRLRQRGDLAGDGDAGGGRRASWRALREAGVRHGRQPAAAHRLRRATGGVRVRLQDGQVLSSTRSIPRSACTMPATSPRARRARAPGRPARSGRAPADHGGGLYAAGDVAVDLNQISVAAGTRRSRDRDPQSGLCGYDGGRHEARRPP
jgi:thioredoxin reductase (NADPH)